MKKNDFFFPTDSVVNYEIKGDYIYVFSHAMPTGLSLAILKHTPDSIEWVMGVRGVRTGSYGYQDEQGESTPILTVVKPDEPDVKGVKVLGEHAKLIQLTKQLTEDYSVEIKYWIHFTEMTEDYKNLENLPSESVELIR